MKKYIKNLLISASIVIVLLLFLFIPIKVVLYPDEKYSEYYETLPDGITHTRYAHSNMFQRITNPECTKFWNAYRYNMTSNELIPTGDISFVSCTNQKRWFTW